MYLSEEVIFTEDLSYTMYIQAFEIKKKIWPHFEIWVIPVLMRVISY